MLQSGIISRIKDASFFDKYWQKMPYLEKRAFSPEETEAILNLEELDERLMSGSVYSPDLQLLDKGRAHEVPVISQFSRSVDIDRLVQHYRAGRGFRLQHMENYLRSVATLTQAFTTEIGYPVRANGYFSPAASRGLAPHYDSSDVFVVQVRGSKTWHLYSEYSQQKPVPLYENRFDPMRHQPSVTPTAMELEVGDLLYIPRGYMHAAAAKAVLSIHITFAVLGLVWVDLLSTALRKAAAEHIGLRELVETANGAVRSSEEMVRRAEVLIGSIDLAPFLNSAVEEIGSAHRAHKAECAFTPLLASSPK